MNFQRNFSQILQRVCIQFNRKIQFWQPRIRVTELRRAVDVFAWTIVKLIRMELDKDDSNAVITIKTLQTEIIQGDFYNRKYIVYNIVATLRNPNYRIWNIYSDSNDPRWPEWYDPQRLSVNCCAFPLFFPLSFIFDLTVRKKAIWSGQGIVWRQTSAWPANRLQTQRWFRTMSKRLVQNAAHPCAEKATRLMFRFFSSEGPFWKDMLYIGS